VKLVRVHTKILSFAEAMKERHEIDTEIYQFEHQRGQMMEAIDPKNAEKNRKLIEDNAKSQIDQLNGLLKAAEGMKKDFSEKFVDAEKKLKDQFHGEIRSLKKTVNFKVKKKFKDEKARAKYLSLKNQIIVESMFKIGVQDIMHPLPVEAKRLFENI